MEVSEAGNEFLPMGRIDVLEIPTNNGRVTCSCTLTELQTGQSQKIVLRLKNKDEREKECEKVFGFFRKVLGLKEKVDLPAEVSSEEPESGGEGFPHQFPRGSQARAKRLTVKQLIWLDLFYRSNLG